MREPTSVRERLYDAPEGLAAADLLAFVLRTGTHPEHIAALSHLLVKYGGLGGLLHADIHMLLSEHGIGQGKVALLKAVLEIGKRVSLEQGKKRYKIHSVHDAVNLVRLEMMYLPHEELHVVLLDTKNQVVDRVKKYKGTVNSSVLRVAEVFREAMLRSCPQIIVCHNHPSGDPSPSEEDITVTQQLVEAGKLLEVDLLDHIVIGNPHYVSLKERLQW